MKRALNLVMLALVGSVVASTARSGDLERFCPAIGVRIERWANPVDVPWELNLGPGLVTTPGKLAWGFPLIAGDCQSGHVFPPPPPLVNHPGLASAIRAAEAWRNAGIPPLIPDVSTFSMSATPTFTRTSPGTGTSDLWIFGPQSTPSGPGVVPNPTNLVTCWEPQTTFTGIGGLGGNFTIAVSSVRLDNTTGEILEVDICINTSTRTNSFQGPVTDWSLVEESPTSGSYFSSAAPNTNLAGPPAGPRFGYLDAQGILTHEFGHFAGLGHSLVDGPLVFQTPVQMVPDDFPTMFAYGQAELMSGVAQGDDNCSAYWTLPFTNALMYARRARMLERDDIGALGRGYPGSQFDTKLGAIVGTVRDANGVPIRGASVVAIHRDEPDSNRVGTLSYLQGEYVLSGLEPGSYYLYAEPVDQPPAGPDAGYFFDRFIVPNFVFLGASGCLLNQQPTVFPGEFFDANEAVSELSTTGLPLNAAATAIEVKAGKRTIANFSISTGQQLLLAENSADTSVYRSPRGVRIQRATSPVAGQFVLTVTGPVGATCVLYMDTERTCTIVDGQLQQVQPSAFPPATFTGSGTATFTIPFSLSAIRNRFAQAAVWQVPGGGQVGERVLTNVVSLWETGY